MRTVPLPLVGGAYADESRPWSMQDTVNYLPTMTERNGTRSEEMLKTPPGLKPYQAASSGVVRGTYEAEGRFFAVIGSILYQVSNAGILIPRGTVPGFTRVQFTHNQISLGNEVVVVNGSAGYVYNTVTGIFGRITDEGYPGSASAAFIDSFVLGIEPQGRYAFNSDPAQATSYNTLNRFTSEFKPDRLIALGVSNNELLLLSAGSGEFFENTGASEQPFRSKRITMDKGAAGPHVVVSMDNTLAWLGSDGSFYMLEGYSPRRISTRPIEQAIDGLNWSQAFGFVWKDNGYEVAYWTFPDGRTWGFDAANREWHRRESDGLQRWRANSMTRWNGKWYAGDYNGPRLYEVDWLYPWEWDQEFASERTCAVMHEDQNLVKCPRLELVMDTGMPEVPAVSDFPAQPVGPNISGAAPDGAVGEAYAGYSYTVTAGDAPISSVSIISGALPANITLSNAGVLSTGSPTIGGDYAFTIRVVDTSGLFADLADSITIEASEILPPQLSDWRYLQVGRTDSADYSDPEFDDSAWNTGTAPFGAWGGTPSATDIANGATTALNSAHAYDSRFTATFATPWTAWTRLWLRRTLTLSAVPDSINVICYIEDNCHFYVNGDLVITTPPNHYGGVGQQFTISADSLVVGDNIIAIRCDDEAPSSSSATYADFIIEDAT